VENYNSLIAQPLLSVGEYTPGQAISGLVTTLFPDAKTALDLTYGRGQFWKGPWTGLKVTGMDIDPKRAPDVIGDFRYGRVPFPSNSFDLVVFDPPFHTDMGRGKPSIMGSQFSSASTIDELKLLVERGCASAYSIARLGCIIKCQDYIHGQRAVWMSQWLRDALGEPYDVLISVQPRKLLDRKWTRQLSVWRNHSLYWVWRFDGPLHKPRRR
jgi:hypothetical protein